jgi:signal transduction histidine kinase/ActR/RegA family two-component response regulator
MAFSIYKFRAMLRLLNLPSFIEDYKKLRISLIFHQSLMIFFFLGYIIVLFAYIANIKIVSFAYIPNVEIISELFVGVIFFFGAVFVLLSIRFQRKILNSIKAKYLQSISISRRLDEEQKNLARINEQLRHEITEQKMDAHERSRLDRQLQQSQKMEAVGKLAGGIAHDFNNMLGGISGFAELIKLRYTENNPDLERYIDTILDTSKRAAALTAQLLAFARKGKYQIVNVNMHETIQNVIHLIIHSFDRRIEVIKDFTADSITVKGDKNQLQNAVISLAMNARDAMPEGGELRFATENIVLKKDDIKSFAYEVNPGSYFSLTVTDTGVGMDEDTKTRVFEPFFTTKDFGEGSGLGLSGVYGTIKNHQGFIEVESESGKGTDIKVCLPVVEVEDEESITKEIDISQYSGNVLLIEDDEVLKEMISEMLWQLNFSVTTCKDSKEALEYYRKNVNEIDLVFIDLVMPILNGYDCFMELKIIDANVKAIIMSGHSINGDARKILDLGALAFIQKPFNMKELSKAVYKALSAP